MQRILIINSKGGCGKTTIATNLAGIFAYSGVSTALFDYDPQGSSKHWLELRPKEMSPIHGVFAGKPTQGAVTRSYAQRIPPETERIIIDTPASMKHLEIMDMMRNASAIIVPMLPSSIDRYVTMDFISEINTLRRQASSNVPIGIVANRVRMNTLSYRNLKLTLNELNIPLAASFRDTQNYVRAAEEGVSIAELKLRDADSDLKQWWALINWLSTGQTDLTAMPDSLGKPVQQAELPHLELRVDYAT